MPNPNQELQQINVGAAPNDGQGDPLRTAFIKINSNTDDLANVVQASPPASPIGLPGDQKGWFAFDSTNFYYSFANYDGFSTIWASVDQSGMANAMTNGTSRINIPFPNSDIFITADGILSATFGREGPLVGNIFVTDHANVNNIFATGYGSANGRPIIDANTNATFNNIEFNDTISGNIIASNGTGNISVTANLSPTGNSYALGLPSDPWQNAFFGDLAVTIMPADGNIANAVTLQNYDGAMTVDTLGFTIGTLGNATPVFTVDPIAGEVYSNAVTIIQNNTNSSNIASGSLQTAGGAGIAQDLFVGGDVSVASDVIAGNSIQVGNLAFYGDYVSSIVADGNIEIGTTGSGHVLIESAGFSVITTTNPNPVFNVDEFGQVIILSPTFDANNGAVSITGTTSGNHIAPSQPGAMLQLTGQDGAVSRLYNDGVDNYALFVGRRYNGTPDLPLIVGAGESIVRYGANPYVGAPTNAGFTATGTARIDFVASEDMNTTNQGTEIQFWATPIGSNVNTKILTIANEGIEFQDGTYQISAGIPFTYYGNAFGVATLNSSGQVPASQLPVGAVVYIGNWNAATNTPALVNGVGTVGNEYSVNVAGTHDFGAGPIVFAVGDFVIYTSSNEWQQISGGVGVASFNGRAGAVSLLANDVITAQGYTSYNGNTNPNGYVNAAQAANAAPVQSFNARSGAVVLLSSDVTTALTAGSLTNAKLANSNIIIGNTTATLGATVTNITGLTTLQATTLTGTLSTNAQPNITSVGTLTSVTTSGNVNGNFIIGNGSLLTNINGANVVGLVPQASQANLANISAVAVVAGTVTTNAQPNISSVGILTSLTTLGNITTNNFFVGNGSQITNITGNNVTGIVPQAAQANTANIAILANTAVVVSANAQPNITSVGTLVSLTATGNITGNYHIGNGSLLANITGANVTGAVALAAQATLANLANTAITANTVTTNAQPNITSVGTLTSLTVSGVSNLGANTNVKITGGTVGQAVITDGTGNLSFANVQNISGYNTQIINTWVPTLVASGGGSFTYGVQYGQYVKSGQNVTCFFSITITNAVGVSGTISIGGLPTPSLNAINPGGGALDNYSFAVNPLHVTGTVASAGSTVALYWHDRAGSTNTIALMTAGELGTVATLIGRVTYISAA